MSIVFACIPELLKPKIKEAFPEITFLKVDELDESVHGKPKTPRKIKEKKVKVDSNDSHLSSLS
jgi:hypothetical protein